MNDLFLAASRRQLRFATTKGHITVEDLWSLSLKSLDALAVHVNGLIAPTAVSFLENPDTKVSQELEDNKLRLEILKAVIAVKQDENKAALEASKKRQQKQFLSELLDKKKLEGLANLSEAEIEAQIKALEA